MSTFVAPARRAIVRFAAAWFSGEALSDIEFAVGEALANCAEHGHVEGGEFTISCRCDGDVLSIEIRDAGRGFLRWDANDESRPPANAPRGYGIFIMRQLMDGIQYSKGGAHVLLIKRLPGAAGKAREA